MEMSSSEPHRWHCDYVRLAWDAGFAFAARAPSGDLDKSNLALLDVEHVVRERDVASVERHVETVLRYTLEESKVLDATFVKVFRLAQLSIEYLLFCKRYLDGCVAALKSDCSRQKEEIVELRARIEGLEASPRQVDLVATFGCDRCPKLFSSQEYLDSHIKRRHDTVGVDDSTDRLHSEIKELKERLNVAEKSLRRAPWEEPYGKFDEFKKEIEAEISAIRARNEGRYDKLVGLLESDRTTTTRKDMESIHTQTESNRCLVKTTVHCIDVSDHTDDIDDRIEAKISSGLLSIQQKLDDFSEQLRTSLGSHQTNVTKPQIKPRTKFSTKGSNTTTADELKPDETRSEPDETRLKPDETRLKPDESPTSRLQPDETVFKPVDRLRPDRTATQPDVDRRQPDRTVKEPDPKPDWRHLPELKVVMALEEPRQMAPGSESERAVVISTPPKKPRHKKRVEKSKPSRPRERLPLSVSVGNVLRSRPDVVWGPTSLSEETLLKALRIIGRTEKRKDSPTKKKKKVLKVLYKRTSKENESPLEGAPVVSIKNRSLYDTTDSERGPKRDSSDDEDPGPPVGLREPEKRKKVLFDVSRVIIDSSSDD